MDREDQMEGLIVSSLRGDITPEEEARLLAWRRASEDHERIYRETVTLWNAMGRIRSGGTPGAVPNAALLTAPLKRVADPAEVEVRTIGRPGWRPVVAMSLVAAALILGVAVGANWLRRPTAAPPV